MSVISAQTGIVRTINVNVIEFTFNVIMEIRDQFRYYYSFSSRTFLSIILRDFYTYVYLSFTYTGEDSISTIGAYNFIKGMPARTLYNCRNFFARLKRPLISDSSR